MTGPLATRRPIRLFLDAGVIIEGCFGDWGASKGTLILATLRENFTITLAEAIEREVMRAIARKTADLDDTTARAISESVAGWLQRVRVERWPMPTEEELRAHAAVVLPALRHVNDLPAVVTAMRAKPDWVISTNTAHWSDALAERTGLRITTPLEFLRRLMPQ